MSTISPSDGSIPDCPQPTADDCRRMQPSRRLGLVLSCAVWHQNPEIWMVVTPRGRSFWVAPIRLRTEFTSSLNCFGCISRPTSVLPYGNTKAGFGQRRGFYSRSVIICQTIKNLLLKRQGKADFKGQPSVSVKSPRVLEAGIISTWFGANSSSGI